MRLLALALALTAAANRHHCHYGGLRTPAAPHATYDYSHVFRRRTAGVPKRVAVYLQAAWLPAAPWADLLTCLGNVAQAAGEAGSEVDVFVSVLNGTDAGRDPLRDVEAKLSTLPASGVANLCVLETENRGADVGQWLRQLSAAPAGAWPSDYDVLLKMHAKTDAVWRERGVEALCGTPAQVHSILRLFGGNAELGMVAPLGTVFGPRTRMEDVFPGIRRRYPTMTAPDAFDAATMRRLRGLHRALTGEALKPADALICAGTMFWARPRDLHLEALLDLPKVSEQLTAGYVENLGLEHILERLFATLVKSRGKLVAAVPPAPKPVALYFPQYHAIPENDRFWSPGFTEWTILKPFAETRPGYPPVAKPLSWARGGLGYYDLTNETVRRRQGDLAAWGGVHAFCFYHYWFSGPRAPAAHKVMYKTVEAGLEDGAPDSKFLLSWANEPWNRRWGGEDGEEVLLSQEYGDEAEWREHFDYLLRFFRHPRYLRVRGRPVFVVYRVGHVGDALAPMLRLWRALATEAGLPGLVVLDTLGNFYPGPRRGPGADERTVQVARAARLDGTFHFWPQLYGSGFGRRPSTKTTERQLRDPREASCYAGRYDDLKAAFCVDGPAGERCDAAKLADHYRSGGKAEGRLFGCTDVLRESSKLVRASVEDFRLSTPRQYWGACSGFDRRPRVPTQGLAGLHRVSPAEFGRNLRASFRAMAENAGWNIDANLFFVTAWNEWNEQAVLEPDDVHRFGYLRALRRAVHCVPGRVPWGGVLMGGGGCDHPWAAHR